MDCEKESVSVSEPEKPSVPQEPHRMPTVWVVVLCVIGVSLMVVTAIFGILQVRRDKARKVSGADFTVNGLNVTLDDSFGVYEDQPNVAASEEYNYTAIRSAFALVGENAEEMTAHDYLDRARGVNHVTASVIQTAENGVEYYTFSDSILEGEEYHFFVFAVKGADSFYLGQFFCAEDVHPDTRDEQFADWAKTAREETAEPPSGI